MRRALRVVGMLLVLVVLAAIYWVTEGKIVRVGQVVGPDEHLTIAEIDHTPFDTLLRRYVDDEGLVAYARWDGNAADVAALDDYLITLGRAELVADCSKTERLAFWINAYNAVTLRGILRAYPTSSIRNHTSEWGGYNLWKDLYLWVDGKPFSLDDMEHGVLRKMGEPRIHFAIVCASKGCPPLWNRAYEGATLDEELTANAQRFFARATNLQLNKEDDAVLISQLLEWYGTDFAPTPGQQMVKLKVFFPHPETLGWLDEHVHVSYMPYDWSLNDQPATK